MTMNDSKDSIKSSEKNQSQLTVRRIKIILQTK